MFTHFFGVFALLILAGFLKMLGVAKTCVKNDMHTDSKIFHLFCWVGVHNTPVFLRR